MNAQDIVAEVATQLKLDQPASEKVVGTIFSVVAHEADGTRMGAFFSSIPGALDLARQYDVMAPGANAGQSSGGLLGTLSTVLGSSLGEKTGALVNGLSQLRASGLDAGQIRQAGATLVERAKAAAGPDVVNEVVGSVPGLAGHLGL